MTFRLWTYTLLIVLVSLFTGRSLGQDIDPEAYRFVIGAAGMFAEQDSIAVDATVGEPITFTGTSLSLIVTQGFQQTNYVLTNPYIVDLVAINEACLGASDGAVVVDFISDNIEAPYSYEWSTGDTSSDIAQLNAGTYSVTVTGSNGIAVTNSVEVDIDVDVECTPRFYTGITPNSDGFNDQWVIENAQFFTTREVRVFNRYGDSVWDTTEYNNDSDFFDGRHRNGQDLPDGTYFYVANFNGVTYEGWLEISR